MRAIAFMLMLLAMAGVARAQATFSLDPSQGQHGGEVNLRVDHTEGCFSAGDPEVVRDGTTVRVRFEIEDFIPVGTPPGTCPPYRVTPRFHSLGVFATGHYVVEVTTCSNPTMGPPCTVQATLELSVFGSNGQRFTVPAAGWPVLMLLAIVLGVAGISPRAR